MPKPIVVIDYEMGNLRSVANALARSGAAPVVTRDPERIRGAAGVVLPGVGAFGACMTNLETLGLTGVVREVIERGTPFLGICLGMQVLFEESEEFGPVRGLGVLRGRCVRFPRRAGLPVPHMGWNRLHQRRPVPHLAGVPEGAYAYFVHSYYVVPEDEAVVVTTTDYGGAFVSAVARDRLFACQFHPEKSQQVGLRLLRNFVAVVREAETGGS